MRYTKEEILKAAKDGDALIIDAKQVIKMLGDEIDKLDKKPTIEELLEKARRDYPSGTKFKDFDGTTRISSGEFKYELDGGRVQDLNLFVDGDYIAIRCDEGTWAEVIEKPIFTNSIGQHFYESEKDEDVFWWDKNNDRLYEIVLGELDVYGYPENCAASEIFKTKKDVLKWAIENIND